MSCLSETNLSPKAQATPHINIPLELVDEKDLKKEVDAAAKGLEYTAEKIKKVSNNPCGKGYYTPEELDFETEIALDKSNIELETRTKEELEKTLYGKEEELKQKLGDKFDPFIEFNRILAKHAEAAEAGNCQFQTAVLMRYLIDFTDVERIEQIGITAKSIWGKANHVVLAIGKGAVKTPDDIVIDPWDNRCLLRSEVTKVLRVFERCGPRSTPITQPFSFQQHKVQILGKWVRSAESTCNIVFTTRFVI